MTTPSTKQLLLHGFIRELSASMTDINRIIPVEIINICYTFYNTYHRKLLIPAVNGMIIVDVNTKKYIQLSKQYASAGPMCYIHDISSLLSNIPSNDNYNQNSNECYDAILCVETQYGIGPGFSTITNKIPHLILLPAEEQQEASYSMWSNTKLPTCYYNGAYSSEWLPFDKFVNCGWKYGILFYGGRGSIYQLKFQNIDLNDSRTLDFRATSLTIDYKTHSAVINKNPALYSLAMDYLQGHDKLFCVQTFDDRRGFRAGAIDKAFCGLIDLGQREFTRTCNYEFILEAEGRKFKPGICHYGYAPNEIYCVSNTGVPSKYDMIKEEWMLIPLKQNEILSKEHQVNNDYVNVWMEDVNTLCMMDGLYLAQLDVRCKDAKWSNIQELLTIINSQRKTGNPITFKLL